MTKVRVLMLLAGVAVGIGLWFALTAPSRRAPRRVQPSPRDPPPCDVGCLPRVRRHCLRLGDVAGHQTRAMGSPRRRLGRGRRDLHRDRSLHRHGLGSSRVGHALGLAGPPSDEHRGHVLRLPRVHRLAQRHRRPGRPGPPVGDIGGDRGGAGPAGLFLGESVPHPAPDPVDASRWVHDARRDARGHVGERGRLHPPLRRPARRPDRRGQGRGGCRPTDHLSPARRCGPRVSTRSRMSDTVIVAGTYLISYGLILGYAIYLHLRRRRAGG